MEIRLLDSNDVEWYRALRLKSLQESPEAFLTTYELEAAKPIGQLRNNLEPADGKFTLGAVEGNELAGMVTFIRENNPKTLHKGNIYAMYVSPQFRGKGAATALLQELLRRAARLEGLERINLTVMADNTAAMRLYERLGFTVYGTERNALKVGNRYWDEVLMVLRLN
ncbi:GNAT family N-acetyltransferase [Paenibacillus tepidiphilus]|uniref:GNAT family N-acetyltransferase n=1 Tax=Paenibacillus tepidiphilus TaxID=2608683 RepID=UPI001239B48E|nr:GNAT family N-acetyltransferase [Paenibacillus tepidiphilus]